MRHNCFGEPGQNLASASGHANRSAIASLRVILMCDVDNAAKMTIEDDVDNASAMRPCV